MENAQNNTESKKTVLVTVVAGIVVLGILLWWVKQVQAPQQVQIESMPDPETAAINQDVDDISVGDLNAEFNIIDSDLRGL